MDLSKRDFYLGLHEVACGHFEGAATCTLMGQDKVGEFRDSDDFILANFAEPDYLMSDEAINEFNALNAKIGLILGSSFRMGDMLLKSRSPKSVDLYYFTMSRDQVSLLFNFFLTEFYYDIGHANNEYSQIQAIAKLIQRMEWLHPVKDGCGRTDTALLNYLLTCYGFNPVLLKFPYVSSCMGLKDWTAAVLEGIKNWRMDTNNS